MIELKQVKLPIDHSEEELQAKIAKLLKIKEAQLKDFYIDKKSVDARKKPELYFVYTILAEVSNDEGLILKRCKDNNIGLYEPIIYRFPKKGSVKMKNRPVIVGSGPAGMFCAYLLAEKGYKPILLERGMDVDRRTEAIDQLWKKGTLNPKTNVQFGEGGAGTFSDGKLNTLVKDKHGRSKFVLGIYVNEGAPDKILYEAKPHIGTDILVDVVKNMRNHIIEMGGEVRFESQVTDFIFDTQKAIKGVVVNGFETIDTQIVVLAIGHSARDTMELLYSKNVPMEAKSFAVGLRVEHPQAMINHANYGMDKNALLDAAPYKLAGKGKNGRGVYSFCNCPGGYVVDASSEEGRLAVNGMSYSDRGSSNANSAIIVAVTPEDFEKNHPLAGIDFQRKLEEKAYKLGNGKIPVQLFGDFIKGKVSQEKDFKYQPCIKGSYQTANLKELFAKEISDAFIDGMIDFGKTIKGFDHESTILSAVESRTSSPVRILRDENLQSTISGLFPCGEGAGYAGGIMSAAMDGIKVAEMIASNYDSF